MKAKSDYVAHALHLHHIYLKVDENKIRF